MTAYKQTILNKDVEVKALKDDILRIREQECDQIASRYEAVLKETREQCQANVDGMREEAARQRIADQRLIDEKEAAIGKLLSDNEKLKIELFRVNTEYEKTKSDFEREKNSLKTEKEYGLKLNKDRELEDAKNLAVFEHKYNTAETEL